MSLEFDGHHAYKTFACRKTFGSYICFYGILKIENPHLNDAGNLTFIDQVDGKILQNNEKSIFIGKNRRSQHVFHKNNLNGL